LRERLRGGLLGAFVALCLAALIWPGYELLGNRLEPRVLGLPLSLAWNTGWVILSFLVLAVYHATGRRED
jgi:hypothetical protein